MEDFSVKKSSVQNVGSTNVSGNDYYAKLEKEYDQTRKKLNKSDFANSPSAIEKELSMIAKLKIAAKEQGLDGKLAELEEREQALYKKLSNDSYKGSIGAYYNPVSFKGKIFSFPKKSETYLDYTQERFVNFLSQDFENEDVVKYNLQVMCDMGVDINSAISILDSIKVKNPKTGLNHINQDTFKKLISIKKLLSTTSNKEREEYNSPVNQLGVEVFSVGKDTIIFKNGKVQYISPVEEKSVQCMQEEYDKAVSDEEDKLLYEFAVKYKDKQGHIDSIPVRVFSLLRQAGVIRNQILDLMDMCISSDGKINKNAIDTIVKLKKAGALSSDVKLITDSLSKDEKGLFDKLDVDHAALLTGTVMDGKDVVSFLPAMRTGEEASEYIINFSNIFGPEYTSSLLNLVEDKDGIPDENAMDVVNALLNNSSIYNEKGEIKAEDFVKLARHMVGVAKDFNTSDSVNEEAVELIFQMCRSSFPLKDIEGVLSRCLNDKGKVDKTLAKILWHMTWDEYKMSKMNEVLDVCSDGSAGAKENARNILKYLEDNT